VETVKREKAYPHQPTKREEVVVVSGDQLKGGWPPEQVQEWVRRLNRVAEEKQVGQVVRDGTMRILEMSLKGKHPEGPEEFVARIEGGA
jgi:hypothetical protein